MDVVQRVRFRDAVRIGAEEVYYAFNGGAKDYRIYWDGRLIHLNDELVPESNVIQFSIIPHVGAARKRAVA